jgi:hypothetical protein
MPAWRDPADLRKPYSPVIDEDAAASVSSLFVLAQTCSLKVGRSSLCRPFRSMWVPLALTAAALVSLPGTLQVMQPRPKDVERRAIEPGQSVVTCALGRRF